MKHIGLTCDRSSVTTGDITSMSGLTRKTVFLKLLFQRRVLHVTDTHPQQVHTGTHSTSRTLDNITHVHGHVQHNAEHMSMSLWSSLFNPQLNVSCSPQERARALQCSSTSAPCGCCPHQSVATCNMLRSLETPNRTMKLPSMNLQPCPLCT